MKTFLAAILSICILAGCSPSKKEDVVTVWHWMADRHKVFETLAAKYQAQTGVKVKFELYEPSAYSKKILASAQAKVLPDIFGILDKKEIFASFVEAGFVVDLTAEYEAHDGQWKRQFFSKALETTRFAEDNIYGVKPGDYGVPIDVTNIQMVYNKDILARAGVAETPQTWTQFLDAARKVSSLGVAPFVSGWGEIWIIDCFASSYALNIMGQEKLMDTYAGKVPYTDPDWIRVFELFDQLGRNNVLITGVVTKSNKQAEQDFALQRAAFAFDGSWCVNVYNGMNPQLQYGTMLLPLVNADRPMKIWGGAGSSFVVNRASSRQQQAIDFLKWLTSVDQQEYLSAETRNLPANQQALKNISGVLSEFAAGMDATTHPSVWPRNENPFVFEAFSRGIQSIIIGEKTPRQVAQEVQEIKRKTLEIR